MLVGFKPDAGLFLVHTGGSRCQGFGTGVFPQGAKRFLQLLKADVGTQRHLAMDVNFKGSVVTGHGIILSTFKGSMRTGELPNWLCKPAWLREISKLMQKAGVLL